MKRFLVLLFFSTTLFAQQAPRPLRPVHTFSIVARDPDVAGFMSSAGGGNNASGQGRMILRLRDRPEARTRFR